MVIYEVSVERGDGLRTVTWVANPREAEQRAEHFRSLNLPDVQIKEHAFPHTQRGVLYFLNTTIHVLWRPGEEEEG